MFVFRDAWKGMDILLHKAVSVEQNWLILCRDDKRASLQMKIGEIKVLAWCCCYMSDTGVDELKSFFIPMVSYVLFFVSVVHSFL